MKELIDFDFRLFKLMNGLAGFSFLSDLAFAILADSFMFLLIGGLALFILAKKEEKIRNLIALEALAAAFIGRAIIVSLVRILVHRSRPFILAEVTQLLNHNPLEGSFPSGHTTVMFAMAFTLVFSHPRWGIPYLLLSTISSFSRVIVGVHFPFDILAGVFIGGISAVLTKWLFKFWLSRRKKRALQQQ